MLVHRHAFGSASVRVDSCSGEVLRDCFGRPISLDPELAEIIASERLETASFLKVPSPLLLSHSWKKVMADNRFFNDILRLEALALVTAASRAAHSQHTTPGHCYSVTIKQV